MTSTSQPSASRRSTSVEPMNPAPPVTITRIGQPSACRARAVGLGATDPRPRRACAGVERRARADDRVVGRDRADAELRRRRARSRSTSASVVERPRRRARPNAARARPAPTRAPGADDRAGDARTGVDDRAGADEHRGFEPRLGVDRRPRPAPRHPATCSRARRRRAAERAARARRRAPGGTSRACRCRSSTRRSPSRKAAGSSSMRGNVSRSIETVSRSGCARAPTARARRCRR